MRSVLRPVSRLILALVALSPGIAALAGGLIGPRILHPMNLNPPRREETAQMLSRTGATKEDFVVRALDGVELRGWKVRPPSPAGDWVLLFHGISDNRTGVLGHAEFLLRHGYCVVMMDARAHGESAGSMATYGWKERYDTVAVTNALYSTEHVRNLFALGVSMGGAIALQSAAVEPRIEAVVAEDPFASLREVSYDYAGLDISPLLGKTLFRPAVMLAMRSVRKEGGFNPDDVSPEQAVASRAFPVLLICGARDHRIPCRHARRIYQAARGLRELWIVDGAGHAAALGHSPAEYEQRVTAFFAKARSVTAGQDSSKPFTINAFPALLNSFEVASSKSHYCNHLRGGLDGRVIMCE
ncbi:MAG TPA: alpha/beta fold hydrolase [Candidatus Acidoferrum sp.]|nr:alpha/beta fold hydrolase [Candidatus Acidoferrum sp.]